MTHPTETLQPIRRTSATVARPDYSALRQLGGFLYLATPYTNYNGGGAFGREMAFHAAVQLRDELQAANLRVFSPIALGYMAGIALGDELTHTDWLEVDAPFMRRARGLVVATMQGWRHSVGVQHEIAAFEAAGKPIFFLDVDSREILHHAPGAKPEAVR